SAIPSSDQLDAALSFETEAARKGIPFNRCKKSWAALWFLQYKWSNDYQYYKRHTKEVLAIESSINLSASQDQSSEQAKERQQGRRRNCY
ncbi:hypothetical protein EC973_007624, partial [Apophysomyces ossiformis]